MNVDASLTETHNLILRGEHRHQQPISDPGKDNSQDASSRRSTWTSAPMAVFAYRTSGSKPRNSQYHDVERSRSETVRPRWSTPVSCTPGSFRARRPNAHYGRSRSAAPGSLDATDRRRWSLSLVVFGATDPRRGFTRGVRRGWDTRVKATGRDLPEADRRLCVSPTAPPGGAYSMQFILSE